MAADNLKNERIAHIDSLKGLAMLMVLIGHVLGFCTIGFDNAIIRHIVLINMPLFFFLNGIVLSGVKRGGYLITKCRQILLPFFAWGVIITLYRDANYLEFIESFYKFGYWYLLVLFYYLVIYYIIEVTNRNINSKYQCLSKIASYVFIYLICRFFRRFISPEINNYIDYTQFFEYLPYFVMGIAIKQLVQYDIWKKHIDVINNFTFLFAIVCYILWSHYIGGEFLILLLRVSLIICIYQIFATYSHPSNSTAKIINNQLIIIGRHTLAIYMIQYYFFRYIDLKTIGVVLMNDNNWITIEAIAIFVSILICYICIAIEKIILMVPLLRFALLGKKFPYIWKQSI